MVVFVPHPEHVFICNRLHGFIMGTYSTKPRQGAYMLYAQFYQQSVTQPRETIQATGDRAVVILDARCMPAGLHAVAGQECLSRGYSGYRFFKGDSFSTARPHSDYFGMPVYYVMGEAQGNDGAVPALMTTKTFPTRQAAERYKDTVHPDNKPFVVTGPALPVKQGE